MATPLTASEYFDLFAPELASDSRKDAFLETAAFQMSSASRWGNVYNQAQALLAAHMLTRSPSDGSQAEVVGAVTNRSAGNLSVGRAPLAASGLSLTDAELASTRYGADYLRLRNTRAAARAGVVRPS